MQWILRISSVVVVCCTGMWAQVTIVNPHRLVVPEDRVNLLFRTSCEVVTREFNLRDPRRMDFPLTLVLGEKNEQLELDEDRQIYRVLLDKWDESKFVTSVMRLAVWRVVPRARRNELVLEILKRANTIEPVNAQALRAK